LTKHFIVKISYKASNPDPIAFCIGDCLSVEDRESNWKGWTWCRSLAGTGGWVPKAYLNRQGNMAVALQDYDAIELTVDPGEHLTGTLQESGWLWCTKPSGLSGWVPYENLEKLV
jgi:hypothetical protein